MNIWAKTKLGAFFCWGRIHVLMRGGSIPSRQLRVGTCLQVWGLYGLGTYLGPQPSACMIHFQQSTPYAYIDIKIDNYVSTYIYICI